MSRFFRAIRQARAPLALGLLLGASSLSAQVLLYVPASAAKQLWEYGITMTSGNPYAYPTAGTVGNQPNTVAVTPNNQFMYVGDADGTIDAFKVNYDGTLVAVGAPFANAGGVRGIAIDPTGKFLYASDNPGARIFTFSINQTTGALTSLGNIATPGGAQPRGMAVDNANHLYVAFAALDQVGQYSINSTTGALTQIAAPIAAGTTPDRVAVTPNGQFVYASNQFGDSISIYSVGGGGALSSVGATATGSSSRPLGLAIHPSGTFLIVALSSAGVSTNVLVYSIAGNGTLSQVASGSSTGAINANATGVTLDPSGQYVFVSNAGNATVTKFNIALNGALSSSFNFATGANPQFLLARPAPIAPGVPTLSTWSLVLLGMMLMGSAAFLYRRAYR
jgi:6-phosphogluconolactonase (cycloisomerase 2 family)